MTVARDGRDGALATSFLEGAPVPVLPSRVNTAEPQFDRNRERMRALVEDLQTALGTVRTGGGKESVERHRSRGKLTARERIDRLIRGLAMARTKRVDRPWRKHGVMPV
jgi:acetyl-CoA carboxylase carboxyltransferase component